MDKKMDKKIQISIISFLLITILGVIFSGCINPIGQVPVIKVDITLAENQSAGIVDAVKYTLTQGNVSYIDRPKKTEADSFPAIAARETLVRGKEVIVGPWEMTNYTGSGDYLINIGFRENHYPVSGDNLHVTIMVVDKVGTKIGYVVDNIKWK